MTNILDSMDTTFSAVVDLVNSISKICCNSPPRRTYYHQRVEDPADRLLGAARVHTAILYVSSAQVWMVVQLIGSHGKSYKLSPLLYQCLATTLWFANVVSLLQFQGGLRVPTPIPEYEVALLSQTESHEVQDFQWHLTHFS